MQQTTNLQTAQVTVYAMQNSMQRPTRQTAPTTKTSETLMMCLFNITQQNEVKHLPDAHSCSPFSYDKISAEYATNQNYLSIDR